MKEDSDKVPSLLTDYILKGEFYNGVCVMVGKFWLVDKCIIVLLIDKKVTSKCTFIILICAEWG